MRKEYLPEIPNTNISKHACTARTGIPGLKDSILGALAYLYVRQVREDCVKHSLVNDFLSAGPDGPGGLSRPGAVIREFLGRSVFPEQHLAGSWPCFIHFLPDQTPALLRPFYTATDYNLFSTASTAYPLLLFDDSGLPEGMRPVEGMLEGACRAVGRFRRGAAYNFWLCRKARQHDYLAAAPLNVPQWIVDLRRRIYEHTGLLAMKGFYEADLLMRWLDDCYNERVNPGGSEAVFNIPDDADNTSMAVALQLLSCRRYGWQSMNPDISPLDFMCGFRDLGREKSDRKNRVFGKDTGAFLTWLKDERLPVYSGPEEGIIPLWANNVDIVINANALLALSLAGKQDSPGYDAAAALLAKCIMERSWTGISLYYPEKLVFPYSVARAWRDGGAGVSVLDDAMPDLVVQLLEEQARFGRQRPDCDGAFPSDPYGNCRYSTALGLAALVNLGVVTARKAGCERQFLTAVDKAALFLLRTMQSIKPEGAFSSGLFGKIRPAFWASGIIYTSSLQPMAHWRSHLQTTALVLEALSKYYLGYDLTGEGLLAHRICLHAQGGRITGLSVMHHQECGADLPFHAGVAGDRR